MCDAMINKKGQITGRAAFHFDDSKTENYFRFVCVLCLFFSTKNVILRSLIVQVRTHTSIIAAYIFDFSFRRTQHFVVHTWKR